MHFKQNYLDPNRNDYLFYSNLSIRNVSSILSLNNYLYIWYCIELILQIEATFMAVIKFQACIGTNSAVHLVILIKNEKCKMVTNCDSYVVFC